MRRNRDSKRRIQALIEVGEGEFVRFELTPAQCKRIACDLLDLAFKRYALRKMNTPLLRFELWEPEEMNSKQCEEDYEDDE